MTSPTLTDINLEAFSLISKYILNNKNLSEDDKNMIFNKLLPSFPSQMTYIYDLNLNPLSINNSHVKSAFLHSQSTLIDSSIEEILSLYKKRRIKSNYNPIKTKPISQINSLTSKHFPYKNQSSFLNSISKKEYFHLKTILGHLSLQDDMLGPIPIYCVVSIQKIDMFVTGDLNG